MDVEVYMKTKHPGEPSLVEHLPSHLAGKDLAKARNWHADRVDSILTPTHVTAGQGLTGHDWWRWALRVTDVATSLLSSLKLGTTVGHNQ
jgi:hypothetical protein